MTLQVYVFRQIKEVFWIISSWFFSSSPYSSPPTHLLVKWYIFAIITEDHLLFSFSLYFYNWEWKIFIALLSLLNSFLCSFSLLLSTSLSFFILAIVFYSSKLSIISFHMSSICLLKFAIVLSISSMFTID
jgi:hypothetical protein